MARYQVEIHVYRDVEAASIEEAEALVSRAFAFMIPSDFHDDGFTWFVGDNTGTYDADGNLEF